MYNQCVKQASHFSFELLPAYLLVIFGTFSAFLIYKATNNSAYIDEKHLSLLAYQFTHLKLYLDPALNLGSDVASYHGRQYLYLGPFPSFLIAPFVLIFGVNFPQLTLGIASLAASFVAMLQIAKAYGFKHADRLWLATFTVFSTSLFQVGITNISTYVVQALGAALILCSLAEYYTKRRWLVIGLLVAAAGMTRVILFGSVLFYILQLGLSAKRRYYIRLILPIALAVAVLGFYNYLRFDSFLETGYRYNQVQNPHMLGNLAYGFFSIKHLPANLYVLLFKAPEAVKLSGEGFFVWFPFLRADQWGMAIWFTSPLLVFLVCANKKNLNIGALVTVLALALPSLLYFGIGHVQFGYRYSLDFMPFLLLVLLGILRPRLSFVAKVLIAYGVIFNCLYFASLWGVYPHFFGDMNIF